MREREHGRPQATLNTRSSLTAPQLPWQPRQPVTNAGLMRAIRAPIWVTITRAARGWQPDRFAWYESAFFLILRHVRARFSKFSYGIENQCHSLTDFFRIIRRLRPARTVNYFFLKFSDLPRTRRPLI